MHPRRSMISIVIAGGLIALGGLAMALVPATASRAEPPPAVASLPTSVAPPPVGNGVPFGINPLAQISGASLDLAPFGYVEEEFIVSGNTNVYQYGATGAVEIKTPNVPYATRILVRRPANANQFSGKVFVEGGPGTDGIGWPADYILDNGHVWVSIFTHGLFSSVGVMQAFDPVRYAGLTLTDFGQNWDLMAQVGRLLKTQGPLNPLNGFDVTRVYANGWSGGASIWWFYINEGFHQQERMPDAGPIYDGYLVGEPSGYSPVNQVSFPSPVGPGDPRWTVVLARDVPAIVLHSRPQQMDRRRSDSDAPNDRYRVYEVAGATHASLRLSRAMNQPADAFLPSGPFGCVHEISRFPFDFYFQSALARVDAWADQGVTPPSSVRLELNPNGTVKLDEHGNEVGGVRSTYLDVPTHRFFTNAAAPGGNPLCTPADGLGAQEQFSPEKLDSLYRNHGGYVSTVLRRITDLEQGGWLLPADANELRVEAAEFDGI